MIFKKRLPTLTLRSLHRASPLNRFVNDNDNEEQPYQNTRTLKTRNIILGFLRHLRFQLKMILSGTVNPHPLNTQVAE